MANPQPVSSVTAIIVNFKTLNLVKQAYESLKKVYSLPLLLIDNGSRDASTDWVRDHGGIGLPKNIGHGPAMHFAIKQVTTPYFLTMDSDCVITQGGFLEEMLPFFEGANAYAIGWQREAQRETGVPITWFTERPPKRNFVRYIHPVLSLYDRAKYNTLKPFNHHGAPVLQNMLDAEAHGYSVKGFSITKYTTHLGAGTRRMYNGSWNPKEGEAPTQWRKDAVFSL